MMRYMLDTNICIYLINKKPEQVIKRFKACKKGEIVMSSITWAELCCGLDIHNHAHQFDELAAHISVVDFDRKAAVQFGILSQQFPNRKSSFDRMIVAHAIALGLVLVTNNPADFSLYDLSVENWTE